MQKFKQKLNPQIFIAAVSGGIGGYVFKINSSSNIPTSHALISGALIGTVGAIVLAQKLAVFLNQPMAIAHFLASGAISGLAYNPVINSVQSIVSAKLSLHQLQAEVVQTQIQTIEQIETIAQTENGAARKAIALDKLESFADEDNLPEQVLEQVVESGSAIAIKSSPELKIEQIERLEKLYYETDNAEIKADIITDLEKFATGEYSDRVTQAAWKALEITN